MADEIKGLFTEDALTDGGIEQTPHLVDQDEYDAIRNASSPSGANPFKTSNENPIDHATRHENGGADEIDVGGLSGELADPQPPKAHTHVESDVTNLVSDLAAKVPKSAFTAKGDILAGTGAGAYNAKTVGANGTVLAADDSQADGVAWKTPFVASDFQYIESEGESTTQNGAYQQKVRLSFTPIAAGDYLIEWNAGITIDSTSRSVQVRCQLDDTTDINEVEFQPEVANQYMMQGGFKKVALTLAAHTIDIDFRVGSTSGSPTAKIRRVRVMARRIS